MDSLSGDDKLSWSALEYEHKERTSDWFWALGVIIVAGSLAAIIFSNYFFAILILLAGALLGFFAIKEPDTLDYELNEDGLKVHNRLYPYDRIKSFWVQTSYSKVKPGLVPKPMLFIKSERVFMPILSIPIDDSFAQEIQDFLLAKNIPEEEMFEHPSETIMDFLGF